ncbi:hypothetical protein ONZ43_g2066 [Nemania bipapillata]|uniref:Uncharacterized protein n=1 Tax=Nemania bipapillata TaxID=110536 RepID=A0ACC2J288_9PEZI|nr:hypothetical protein ONZ43_g2066 [Nemania bipapillata]
MAVVTVITVQTFRSLVLRYEHNRKFLAFEEGKSYEADPFSFTHSGSLSAGPQRAVSIRQPAPIPSLRITTGDNHTPKNPVLGFVFGSDPEVCDVIIADANDEGVGGKEFAITGNWGTGALLIRNLNGPNGPGLFIDCDELGYLQLFSQRTLPILDALKVTIGHLDLIIKCPDHRKTVKEDWAAYCKKMWSLAPDPRQWELGTDLKTLNRTGKKVYRVYGKIGQGARGIVYKVEDTTDGNFYAAKQSNIVGDYIKEEAALRQISHKYIVEFIEIWKSKKLGDLPMLVLEFIEGGDLGQAILHRPLTAVELQQCLKQLLKAAKYLHDKGITHRDIKPANIMVKSRNPLHVKLADFGLASLSPDNLKTECGTTLFGAPEVLGPGYYTSKVDIWSIGIAALQCCHQLPPYPYREKDKWPAILNAHLASLEPNLTVQLISDLLQPLACDRLSAEQALKHPFFTSELDPLPLIPLGTTSDQQTLLPAATGAYTSLEELSDTTTLRVTRIAFPSRNSNVAPLETRKLLRNISSPGWNETVPASTAMISDSGKVVTDKNENDYEDSSVLYYHQNPLRDPLIVGSEIEKIWRETAAEKAARKCETGAKESIKESEISQLPEYDFLAQASPSVRPDHMDRSNDDKNVVLGDTTTFGHPATADDSASLPSENDAGLLNLGSSFFRLPGENDAGLLNLGSSFFRLPGTSSTLQQQESTISITSNYLQAFYDNGNECYDKVYGELGGELGRMRECQVNGISAENARPPETPEYLFSQAAKLVQIPGSTKFDTECYLGPLLAFNQEGETKTSGTMP